MFTALNNTKFQGNWFGGNISATADQLISIFGKPNAGLYSNSWILAYDNIEFGIIPDTDAVESDLQKRRWEIITRTKEDTAIIKDIINDTLNELTQSVTENSLIFNIIKSITEAYIDSESQMNNAIKSHNNYNKKRSVASEKNQILTQSIFGPRLFKQYMNNGNMDSYAPIPLSGINLSLNDFQTIYKKYIADDETLDKVTNKIIENIKKKYTRRQFVIRGELLFTDIVFKTFDELCDFIANVDNSVRKALKTIPDDCINWKPFVSKFRSYMK